ncbi:MAG: hypothetical protein M0R47_16745 [Methylobacter sp.]|uniref:hypothetical protein n=1 Tax=Methylobacter sp. TaxID=2051955 RepID=UPI0025F94172|nr:hypothetical protein [Methylobacter sp.]MCK9622171.1 hypothetical protein [Methylobacter sp.]
MSLAFELQNRQQASRYVRRQHHGVKHNYIGALMTISVLFGVGLISLGYYEYHRYQQAMTTPAHSGCVISQSEAREVLHIAAVKPERRK